MKCDKVFVKKCLADLYVGSSQVVLLVKNMPANPGDPRDVGSIPGLGRFPGGGDGNPFQYSCLENSMDRGAWWATVHGAAQSQTRLKQLSGSSSSSSLFPCPDSKTRDGLC